MPFLIIWVPVQPTPDLCLLWRSRHKIKCHLSVPPILIDGLPRPETEGDKKEKLYHQELRPLFLIINHTNNVY
jgi:hypothetical protein